MKAYFNLSIFIMSLLVLSLFVQCKSEVQYGDAKTVMADHRKNGGYTFKLGTEMKKDCARNSTFGNLTYLNPLPKDDVAPQAKEIQYDKCERLKATLIPYNVNDEARYQIEATIEIDEIEQKAREYFCPVSGSTRADCVDAKYATSLLFVMAHTFSGAAGERKVMVDNEKVTYEQAVYDMRTKGLVEKGIVYKYIPHYQMKEYSYEKYLSSRSDTEDDLLRAPNFYAKTWLSALASYIIFNHLETKCKKEEAVTSLDPGGTFDAIPSTTITQPTEIPPYCKQEINYKPSKPGDASKCIAGDRMKVKGDTGATVYIKRQVSGRNNTEHAMALVKEGTIMTSDGLLDEGRPALKLETTLKIERFVTITNTNERMVVFDFKELSDNSGTAASYSPRREGYVHIDQLKCITTDAAVDPPESPSSDGVKYAAFMFQSPHSMDIYVKLENGALTAVIDLPTSPPDVGLQSMDCPSYGIGTLSGTCYGKSDKVMYQVIVEGNEISGLSLFLKGKIHPFAYKYTNKTNEQIEQKISSMTGSSGTGPE